MTIIHTRGVFNFLHFTKKWQQLSIIRFNRKNQMSQVFNIYWQAWGYEQAQLQKQLYITPLNI